MNRAEILAKAINALEAATYSGVSTTAGMAKAVTDAVLSAVADDLDAQACRPKAWSPSQRTGIAYAANHIRALVEEGKTNDS